MKEIYKLPWQFWALTIFLICMGCWTCWQMYIGVN